jgi:hypothetical protein
MPIKLNKTLKILKQALVAKQNFIKTLIKIFGCYSWARAAARRRCHYGPCIPPVPNLEQEAVCHPFSGGIHSSKEEEAPTCRKLCATPAPRVSTTKEGRRPDLQDAARPNRKGARARCLHVQRGPRVVTTVAGRGRAPVAVLAREGLTLHRGSALDHGPELPRRVSQRGSRRGPIRAPEAPPPNLHESPACSRWSSRIVGFAPATGRELAPSSTHHRTPCCFLSGELAVAPQC